MHILDHECEGLADKLAALSLDVRRRIISEACVLAASSIADIGPETQELLATIKYSRLLRVSQIRSAELMAIESDRRYFDLEEEGAPPTESLTWFSKARLLTAIRSGFGDTSWESSADAIYELSKTTDDPSDLFAFVVAEIEK